MAFEYNLYSSSEKNAIVLDVGTSFIKCGFAGEGSPRAMVRSRIRMDETMPLMGSCGEAFLAKSRRQWEGELEDLMQDIFFRKLAADPKDRKVVLCEDILMPRVFMQALVHVLLVKLEVPSVAIVAGPALTLYTVPLEGGIVLDCGYSETRVLPVFAGVPLIYAATWSLVGGRAVDEHLQRLLIAHCAEEDLTSGVAKLLHALPHRVVEDIKVRACFVHPTDALVEAECVATRWPAGDASALRHIDPPPERALVLPDPAVRMPTPPDEDEEEDGDGEGEGAEGSGEGAVDTGEGGDGAEGAAVSATAEAGVASEAVAVEVAAEALAARAKLPALDVVEVTVGETKVAAAAFPFGLGRKIHVSAVARAHAADVLFAGVGERPGVPEIFLDCLLRLNTDLRHRLVQKVMLVGGPTMMSGFQARFEHDVAHLAATVPRFAPLQELLHKLRFVRTGFPANIAQWVGGSVLGSMDLPNLYTAEMYNAGTPLPDWTRLPDFPEPEREEPAAADVVPPAKPTDDELEDLGIEDDDATGDAGDVGEGAAGTDEDEEEF